MLIIVSDYRKSNSRFFTRERCKKSKTTEQTANLDTSPCLLARHSSAKATCVIFVPFLSRVYHQAAGYPNFQRLLSNLSRLEPDWHRANYFFDKPFSSRSSPIRCLRSDSSSVRWLPFFPSIRALLTLTVNCLPVISTIMVP